MGRLPGALVAEVLQQEPAHRRVRYRRAKRLVGLRPPLEAVQVNGAHGGDVAVELGGVVVRHRRHVHDDQPLDELGVAQRDDHRDLAAHRVADQGDRVVGGEQAGHLVGRRQVVEVVAPRRATVVWHVDERDPVPVRRAACRWR